MKLYEIKLTVKADAGLVSDAGLDEVCAHIGGMIYEFQDQLGASLRAYPNLRNVSVDIAE